MPASSLERFLYVPMGTRAPEGAISCDGLVEGAALDLSHWVGNRTPAALKADTSTEIALKFGKSALAEGFLRAQVTNNHFDTDGVLSCFAVLEPAEAGRREALMIAAAEAGDFGEWPLDARGLKVDAAIQALGARAGDDAAGYAAALPRVVEILDGIDDFEELWKEKWGELGAAMRRVNDGAIIASHVGGVGLVRHAAGVPELPGPVLARLLLSRSWRYLLAFESGGGKYTYRYELPRYAWADTITRTPLDLPNLAALVDSLGPGFRQAPQAPGGTALIDTVEPVTLDAETVLSRICDVDVPASLAR